MVKSKTIRWKNLQGNKIDDDREFCCISYDGKKAYTGVLLKENSGQIDMINPLVQINDEWFSAKQFNSAYDELITRFFDPNDDKYDFPKLTAKDIEEFKEKVISNG